MSVVEALGSAARRSEARASALRTPVAVVPLPALAATHCSWLLVCGRTRSAAVIDPTPELADTLSRVLEERGLRLQLVLRTRPVEDAAASEARYADLLGGLGLQRPAARAGKLPWAGLPQVAPIAVVDEGRGHPGLRVQAGERELILDESRSSAPRVTVRGSMGAGDADHASSLRAALGAFHVEAIPHHGACTGAPADRDPRLAWLVADRLFSGAALHAAAALPASSAGCDLRTPERVLALPDEVLVYPAVSAGGLLVSTVAQERAARRGAETPVVRHLRVHEHG